MTTTHNIAGRRLADRYMLLSLVAQGGMGEVWKARDQVTGNLVAAKVLRPELTGEEISLSRLRLEAKNAMRAKHPNIAAVLDSGEDDHQGWIVMELVEGFPLTRYVSNGARLSAGQVIPILVQVAYALDAAARAGVVHRDIKPANIIIKSDGKVKLTDFGVSFSDGQASLTAAGMVMGTAQYLPPEQALGKPATPVGDLYALGIIAFEALAGHRPYTGKTQVDIAFAHVNEDIPTLPGDIPESLTSLVYRLLAKDPVERPQTGAALARELSAVASGLGLSTDPLPLTDAAAARTTVTATVAEEAPPPPPVVPPVRHVTRQHLPQSSEPPAPAPSHWYPVKEGAAKANYAHEAEGHEYPEQTTAPDKDRTPRTAPIAAGPAAYPQDAEGSKVGLWAIVGLVALTLILIAIAMVRGPAGASADGAVLHAAVMSQQTQEVIHG